MNRKILFTSTLLGMFFHLSYGQGLVEEYDSACDCTHYTNHFDNGKVSAEYSTNAKGNKDGTEKVYYADGAIQYQRTWVNGKLDGTSKHYFRDGGVYYTETHDMGVKTGKWSFYDQEGDLTQTIEYSGKNNDGKYSYYHAGIHYLSQTVSNGKLETETIHHKEIYDQLKSEAEAAAKVKTK